jgi:hypothetical protein
MEADSQAQTWIYNYKESQYNYHRVYIKTKCGYGEMSCVYTYTVQLTKVLTNNVPITSKTRLLWYHILSLDCRTQEAFIDRLQRGCWKARAPTLHWDRP